MDSQKNIGSNYSQAQIVRVLNQYLHTRDEPQNTYSVRLNTAGVCLALGLAHLKNETLKFYDPQISNFFEQFIHVATDYGRITDFFARYEAKTEKYREAALSGESTVVLKQMQQKIIPYQDIHSVIDLTIFLHAGQDAPFKLYDIEQKVNKTSLDSAGLRTIATTSTMLHPADYANFFNPSSSSSPFENSGRYLVIVPGHALTVSVSEYGVVTYYDPNSTEYLKTPDLVIKEKENFFKSYQTDKNGRMRVDVYAVDLANVPANNQNRSDDLNQKIIDKIDTFSNKQMSQALKIQKLKDMLVSPALRAAYFSRTPQARAVRLHCLDLLKKYAQSNHMKLSDLLFSLSIPDSSYLMIEQLLAVANSAQHLELITELLDVCKDECWPDGTLIEMGLLYKDLSIYNLLISRAPSGLTYSERSISIIEKLIYAGQEGFGNTFLSSLKDKGFLVPVAQHQNLLSYLCDYQYTSLIKVLLAKEKPADIFNYDFGLHHLISWVLRDNNHDIFELLIRKADIPWSSQEISYLMKNQKNDWVHQLLECHPEIALPSDIDLTDCLKNAILTQDLVLISHFRGKVTFNHEVVYEMVNLFTNLCMQGDFKMLRRLFENKIIHEIVSSVALPTENASLHSMQLTHRWLEAFRSVTGVQSCPGDQKVFNYVLKKHIHDRNEVALKEFFELPNTFFKMGEFIFDQRSILGHCLKMELWQALYAGLQHAQTVSHDARNDFLIKLQNIIHDRALTNQEYIT
ncbi:MAG: hypothetical protein FJ161_04680, partial [Gammaproteobacteria bacterium]|nr:hypothetical protein [Gammaproteobacteria bacterium]